MLRYQPQPQKPSKPLQNVDGTILHTPQFPYISVSQLLACKLREHFELLGMSKATRKSQQESKLASVCCTGTHAAIAKLDIAELNGLNIEMWLNAVFWMLWAFR